MYRCIGPERGEGVVGADPVTGRGWRSPPISFSRKHADPFG